MPLVSSGITEKSISRLRESVPLNFTYLAISHLSDSAIWLSDEVPVSLFQPTQVKGVDRHMGAYLSCR